MAIPETIPATLPTVGPVTSVLGPVTDPDPPVLNADERYMPPFIRSVFTQDSRMLIAEVKAEIKENRRRFARCVGPDHDEGHEFLTLSLFDKMLNLIRFHGLWSLEVVAKRCGLSHTALTYYCKRYPQAQELFLQAREEFKAFMGQGLVQRAFALIDNPKADAKAKAMLIKEMLVKFHPDMKDKADPTSLTVQDNRIIIGIKDHSTPPGSVTPLQEAITIRTALPPPEPIHLPMSEAELERRVAEAAPGESLGRALFNCKPPKKDR